MLRQGTENIEKEALAEELDGMGAGLSVDVGYALVVDLDQVPERRLRARHGDPGRAGPAADLPGRRARAAARPDPDRPQGDGRQHARRLGAHLARAGLSRLASVPPTDRRHRRQRAAPPRATTWPRFHTAWYGPNQTTLHRRRRRAARRSRRRGRASNLGDWPAPRTEPVEATLPATDLPRQATARGGDGRQDASRHHHRPADARSRLTRLLRAELRQPRPRAACTSWVASARRCATSRAWPTTPTPSCKASYGRGGWMMRAGVNPTQPRQGADSIDTELKRFLADGPTRGRAGRRREQPARAACRASSKRTKAPRRS